MRISIVLATLVGVGLWGCGDDSMVMDTSVADSSVDTGSMMDAMPDGSMDATPDGSMDATPDGSMDGGDGSAGDGGDGGDASGDGGDGSAGDGGDAGDASGDGGDGGDADAGYDPVARGDYLVNHVWTCVDCHSPRDPSTGMFIPGQRLSGVEDLGMGLIPDINPPNLTPDMDTGLGMWTDTEIRVALTAGIDRDGNRMNPIMPYWTIRLLSESDIDAIIAYLRSIPAVDNTITPMPNFPDPVTPLRPDDVPLPTLDVSDPLYTVAMEGRYLATPCMECHTPEQMVAGAPPIDVSLAFSGGRIFPLPDGMGGTLSIHSKNITQGVNGTMYDSIAMIKNVITASTEICPPMPIGPDGYWGLTDEDAEAIATYIYYLPLQDTTATPMCPLTMP